MCCRWLGGCGANIAFTGLALGLAVLGVASTGMLAFWAGWSIAALSVGYMLAFRMEFLGKITNIISKTPSVSTSLYWTSLVLFVDVYLLVSHQTSLWEVSAKWLLEHMTFQSLIPFLASFGLYHLVILPGMQIIIAPFKAVWRGTSQAKEKCAVALGRLQYYVLQNEDKWAQEIYADAVAFRDEAKQVEASSLSILLLLVTDFLLGKWAGVPGLDYVLSEWLLGLPTAIAVIMGLASLNAVLFIGYLALLRDGQLDGWVAKEKFGKDWLKKHGTEFWDDGATKQ